MTPSWHSDAVRGRSTPSLQRSRGWFAIWVTKHFFMLRNHGLLTVGETVADAFLYMYVFETACAIQVRAQAGGELILVEPGIIAGVKARWTNLTKGAGGALAWPALIRKLDRLDPSYRS